MKDTLSKFIHAVQGAMARFRRPRPGFDHEVSEIRDDL